MLGWVTAATARDAGGLSAALEGERRLLWRPRVYVNLTTALSDRSQVGHSKYPGVWGSVSTAIIAVPHLGHVGHCTEAVVAVIGSKRVIGCLHIQAGACALAHMVPGLWWMVYVH